MGCGCGGNKNAAGAPAGITQFRLTYADGRTQTYLHQQQAEREAARSGAALEVIHP